MSAEIFSFMRTHKDFTLCFVGFVVNYINRGNLTVSHISGQKKISGGLIIRNSLRNKSFGNIRNFICGFACFKIFFQYDFVIHIRSNRQRNQNTKYNSSYRQYSFSCYFFILQTLHCMLLYLPVCIMRLHVFSD